MTDVQRLVIRMLGHPGITLDTQMVAINRRLIRALLYFLAAHDRPVSRARLLSVFWNDESEEDARRHLRESLTKLRSALPDSSIIIADRDSVGLDHSRIEVDLIQFEDLSNRLEHPLAMFQQGILPDHVLALLVQSVSLWIEPEFLSGFSLSNKMDFDEWRLRTGQRLESLFRRNMDRLIDHYISVNDLEGAIKWISRALEGDDHNFDLHFLMLQCLKDLRRFSELQRYCDYLMRLYQAEACEDLPANLRQFCDQPSSYPEKTLPGETGTRFSTSNRLKVPFVGRETELTCLKRSYDQGGVVVIQGETGSGKSRLVETFYHRLEFPPRLLWTSARPLEKSLPFQAWIDLLRRAIYSSEWKTFDLTWKTPLGLLLPELNINPADMPVGETGSLVGSRALVFEALYQLLRKIAQQQKVLFVLDDAQWCDEATLASLSYISERGFFRNYGLLVLTRRLDEPNPVLNDYLFQGLYRTKAPVISMKGFSRGEIHELSGYILGSVPCDDLVEKLWLNTDGNPLYIIETLREILLQSMDITRKGGLESLPTAKSVRDIVRDRVGRLSKAAQNVFSTAAVIGLEFSPRVLQNAAGLSEKVFLSAVEELEAVHLFVPQPEQPSGAGYMFNHNLFREIILSNLSPGMRQALHRHVAVAFEEWGGELDQQSSVIAFHFEEAGDFEKAFKYWLRAGEYSVRMNSRQEAYSAFQHAELMLEKVTPFIPDESLYQLFNEWGDLAYDTDDIETARHVYEKMMAIGQERASDLLIGNGYSGLSRVSLMMMEPLKGMQRIEQSFRFLEKSGHVTSRIKAYNRQGVLLIRLQRFDEAGQSFQKAIDISQKVDDFKAIEAGVYAQTQLALMNILTGYPQLAAEMAEQAAFNSKIYTRKTARVQSLMALGMAYYFQGQYHESMDAALEGIKIADPLQLVWWKSWFYIILANSSFAVGSADECLSYLDQYFQTIEGEKDRERLSFAYSMLGDVYRWLHEYRLAIENYDKALETSKASFSRHYHSYRKALVLVDMGLVEEAASIARNVFESTTASNLGMVWMPAKMTLGIAYCAGNRKEEGYRLLQEAHDEATERGFYTLVSNCKIQLLETKTQNEPFPIPESRNIWININACKARIRWLKKHGISFTKEVDDIHDQLAFLDQNISNPRVFPAYLAFRRKMLEEIA